MACIHCDRSQSQRNEALQGFKDRVYRILVATDVAARGIHVDDIAHVVYYDLPQEPESFIHRIGRTGRAGARGASWTFAIPLERSVVRNIESLLGTKVHYRELPALPRPIGLVSDVQAFLASMGSSQAAGGGPTPTVLIARPGQSNGQEVPVVVEDADHISINGLSFRRTSF